MCLGALGDNRKLYSLNAGLLFTKETILRNIYNFDLNAKMQISDANNGTSCGMNFKND